MTFAKRPLAGSSRAGGAAPAAASWRALAFLPPALLGLAAVWLPYLPNEAGRIGEDYSMWLPNLLAGFYWHVQNGFFSVPWFNPAQCGGIPVQADPQGEYFSLAQFLTFAVPPLRAVQITFFAFASAGYVGTVMLARRFRLSLPATALAGLLFALNSFYGGRMVAGHLSFSPFMLVPLAAACLLGEGREGRRVSGWVLRCGGFALILGAMLEGGMLVLIPPAYLCLLMVLALQMVVTGESPLPAIGRLAAGTLLGLLLCAGKLAAVLSLMAHIPRDSLKLPGYLNVGETLFVAVRALFIGPGTDMQTHLANASVLFQRHEFEYGVGPAALLLLLAFGVQAWRRRCWPAREQRLAMDALILLLLVPLAVNTYGAHWTPFLKTLPVIRNSSSLLRWFAAYILPAAIGAAVALDRLTAGRPAARWPIASGAAALTLVALALAGHAAYGPADIGGYDPAPIDAAWQVAEATRHVPPVTEIGVLRDKAGLIDKGSLARQDSMAQGQSQLFCYDALFGYRFEHFPQGTLHPGSVFEQTDAGLPGGARLNLKNPACYVFPEANECKPGDAFPASEIDQATRFAAYRPFAWHKPIWARAADWAGYVLWPITLLSLLAAWMSRLRFRRPHPEGAAPRS